MLPYNTDILFSIFSHYNSQIWPALLIVHALLLWLIISLLRASISPWLHAGINTLQIITWLWVAIGFYHLHFSDFNFMAPIYAGIFVAQAVLMTLVSTSRWRLQYHVDRSLFAKCGLALIAIGVVLVPLLDWLSGADWHSLRWFASGPEATLLVSVGLLLLSTTKMPWILLIVPLVVSIKIGVLAYFLDYKPDHIFAVVGTCGVVLAFFKRSKRIPKLSLSHEGM